MSSCLSSIKAFISPFALSTILLDNSNCPGDHEGFLLGKSQKAVRYEINDHSDYNTEEDLSISIFSAHPSGKFLSFYDRTGAIDSDYIRKFLGDRLECVIGWYRYRRNVPPYPSAREAIVHRNLMRLFSGNLLIGDNFFTFGVFGSSATDTFSTHTFDYAFYIERPDRFMPLVLQMMNLIDTKARYRNGSLTSQCVNSRSFDSVLNISWSLESNWQTEDSIQQMHKLLRDKCSNLGEELTVSESVNASIESDINLLEEQLASLTTKEQDSFIEDISDSENSDNPESPENIVQKDESIPKPIRKRYWSEVVDFESGKKHPTFGKYFEQNRNLDNISKSQVLTDTSDRTCYIVPPQKKIKVLQESKRIMDHDYSSASDEDSHKYAQEMEEDKGEDLDGISLPSETEDGGGPDGTVSQEIVIETERISQEEEEEIQTNIIEYQENTTQSDPAQVKDDSCEVKDSNAKDQIEEQQQGVILSSGYTELLGSS